MIKLYQFHPLLNLPNLSPFCLKLETWLRMAGLPYESVYTFNPGQGPLGKLPAIEVDGKKVPDSSRCIAFLKGQHGIDLDTGLSAEQQALGLAFKAMFEDRLYWAVVYSRWIDPDYWPATQRLYFGKMPPGLRQLVPLIAQRQVRRDLHGQGLGRHEREQIYAFARADLAAVATFLGDKPYFLGEAPSEIDATAYGFLAQLVLLDMASPLKAAATAHPNLVAYCERMRARYYPGN